MFPVDDKGNPDYRDVLTSECTIEQRFVLMEDLSDILWNQETDESQRAIENFKQEVEKILTELSIPIERVPRDVYTNRQLYYVTTHGTRLCTIRQCGRQLSQDLREHIPNMSGKSVDPVGGIDLEFLGGITLVLKLYQKYSPEYHEAKRLTQENNAAQD